MIKVHQILAFGQAATEFRKGYSFREESARALVAAWREIDVEGVDCSHVDESAESAVSMLSLMLKRETDPLQMVYLQRCLDFATVRLAENILSSAPVEQLSLLLEYRNEAAE